MNALKETIRNETLTISELKSRRHAHILRYNSMTPQTEAWQQEVERAGRYDRLYNDMLRTNRAARRADTARRCANEHHRRAEVAHARWRNAIHAEDYHEAAEMLRYRVAERAIRDRYRRVEAAASKRAYITPAVISDSDRREAERKARHRAKFDAAKARRGK